ncbi:MAG: zinc-binding alcohol dehydrogenase [Saprospiraceae bacterium]
MDARSLWHKDQDWSEIRTRHLELEKNHIILKSLYSLISIGTERLVCKGKIPPNLYDPMKVPFMQGDFALPIKYGYSLIGQVGDHFYHVMHPHQDIVSVPKHSLTLIPQSIPPVRATLISNLETACTAYWDADPKKEENILIVGFGLIGGLIAGWLRLKGFDHISIVETDPYRRMCAERLGFSTSEADDDKRRLFQLAFHCTANGAGLQTCIDRMDHEGRIIEMSWYGDLPVTLNLGSNFHYKRLSIQSSQVSSIPAKLQDSQTFQSRKEEVLKMLVDPYWDGYLDKIIDFERAPEWFGYIRAGAVQALSLIIKY